MKQFYLLVFAIIAGTNAGAQTRKVITCVENQLRFVDTVLCGAYVREITPVLSNRKYADALNYSLSGATQGEGKGPASGLFFNVGKTIVTYRVASIDSCSFEVDVTDLYFLKAAVENLEPVTVCLNSKLSPPVAYSICTKEKVYAIPERGFTTAEPQRNRTITWYYAYNGQYVLAQTQVINVVALNLQPRKSPLDTIRANCSYTVGKPPFLVDKCSGQRVFANEADTTEFTSPGLHVITWRYGSGRLLQHIETQIVIIEGSNGIKLPEEKADTIVGSCDATYTNTPVAFAGCYNEKIGASTKDPTTFSESGWHTISWSYLFNDKVYTQVHKVYVQLDPKFKLVKTNLDTIYASCSKTVTEYPRALFCNGDTLIGEPLNELSFTKPGTYKLDWLYRYKLDTITQTQYLVIKDNGTFIPKDPKLPKITAGCSTTVTKIPVATFGCDGIEVSAKPDRSLNFSKPGTDTITWTYSYENVVFRQQQIVEVSGAGAMIPDIDTLPAITGSCSAEIKEIPTATNDCSGKKVKAITDSKLKYDAAGTYHIEWIYTDENAKTRSQFQTVIIKGSGGLIAEVNELPLLRDDCNITIKDFPKAKDGCSGIIVTAITKDPLQYNKPGKYEISWSYLLDKKEVLTQKQIVVINDLPKIKMNADKLPVIEGSCDAVVNKIPTATNRCTQKIIAGITKDPLKYNEAGTYQITWLYQDGDDTATQRQTVIVTVSGKLTADAAVLPDLTGDCSVLITGIPTATDPCSGRVIKAVTDDPLNYSKPGEYLVNWSYVVDEKQLLTQQQKVIIKDQLKLQPTIKSLPVVEGRCSALVTVVPTAVNSCTGKLTPGTTKDPLSYAKPGTYTISWTYNDGGQSLIQQQKVVVKSSEQLITEQIVLPDLTGECEVNVTRLPVAANSCSGMFAKATTSDPLRYTVPGTYTINWVFRDGGVETKQTQKVIVTGKPEVLKIYPNPTRNEFRIVAEGCNLPENIQLKIFDITGKLMDRRTIQPNREVVFGAAYQGGVYILQVTQGDKTSVMKLIKAK